jgi:ABC-type transporter Mla maintaining outer membrane lipid asymmetry ATPase subunit MlaF
MNTASMPVAEDAVSPRAPETSGVGLACELPADPGSDDRIWIPEGASLRIRIANPAHRARLLAAIFDMVPDPDLRLVLLGAEVNSLSMEEQIALRARVAFLAAAGGLLSNLNAWENIILPLGCHHPERLQGIAAEVYPLVTELGAAPESLLGKLPEEMTPLEKKITGFVRILLEAPDLVLVENFAAGLDSAGRTRIPYFANTYHARHPQGTFVQLEDVLAD